MSYEEIKAHCMSKLREWERRRILQLGGDGMPVMLDKPRVTMHRGQPVALDAESADDAEPKWVQIATEGLYLGYGGGEKPFAFTRATFIEIARNFREHPAYKLGVDGRGAVGIVPWDYNHASEQPAVVGSLPLNGAPSQGWTRDLEVRTGESGKAELWALTQFLEPARTYVKSEQYKWASVAVAFDCVHPVTGAKIGAVLTSIALTNTPFIEGMQQLAASRYHFFEPATSAEMALGSMKDLMGLPLTSGVDEVLGELSKVRSWVQVGGKPLGVDLECLFGDMRKILNLAALASEGEVLDEAGKILARLVEEETVERGEPAAPPAPEEIGMDLIKILSKLLGVREDEGAVTSAIEELHKASIECAKCVGVSETRPGALLDRVGALVQAKADLGAILTALGLTDAAEALSKLPNLIAAQKQIGEISAALADAMKMNLQYEEAAAEAEVASAMAARSWTDPGLKVALRVLRGFSVDEKATPAVKLAALRTGADVFAKQYPAPPDGAAPLLTPVAAAGGAEFRVSADGKRVERAQPLPPNSGNKAVVDVTLQPGRNTTERVQSHIRASVAGADKWNRDQLFTAACDFKRSHVVKDDNTTAVAQ